MNSLSLLHISLFLTLLLSTLLTGCPHTTPRPENALTAPTDLIQQVQTRTALATSLRFQAKGTFWDNKTNRRIAKRPITILAQSPASIFILVKSGFGQALGAMASNGIHFSMLDQQSDIHYQGPATPQNLSMLLPLYLPGSDFVQVLSGGFPTSELQESWTNNSTLIWNEKSGRHRLSSPRLDGGTQIVELAHPGLEVEDILIIDANGEHQYRYRAKSFFHNQKIPIPEKSFFELPKEKIDVTLYLKKEHAEINPELPEELFIIDLPPGITSIILDKDGNATRAPN